MLNRYEQSPGAPEPDTVRFRKMELSDIPRICAIEQECFATPWTEEAFRNELAHNHFARYIVMLREGDIIGYAGMWTIMDEAHVTNIAVTGAQRGKGLGERLLRELVTMAVAGGMRRMTLEVRVSNTVAQRLYEKFGFVGEGLRRGYYSDNQEDALIMWADLPQAGEDDDWE